MEAKHTPGPWTNFTGTHSIWAEGNRSICVMTGARKSADSERDANALLIAAAPDLLEALQRCAEAIREYGRNEGEPTPQDEEMFDAERFARAAIATATGSAA